MSYNPVTLGPRMKLLASGAIDVDDAKITTTATGGTTARTAADRASDELNVLDNGLVADAVTDNFTAFTALCSRAAILSAALGGGRVMITVPSGIYGLSQPVTIPSNVELTGQGSPVFRAIGAGGALLKIVNSNNIAIRRIKLDSQNATNVTISVPVNISGSNDILIEDVELLNPTGEIHVTNSFAVSINRPKVWGSLLHGVYFSGVHDSQVSNGSFQNNIGFGIILTGGCYRNLIIGNRTTKNGIELVGVTQDSYENRIINNHAEGTGDNGISITGFKNIISGNITKGCQGNGIEVYGERNTVTGNTCLNNAQGNAGNTGWRAGIAIHGAFGGVGQWNTITGNILDDEQATATQIYGVWINATTYQPWAAGQAVAAGDYRYVGLNLYKTTGAGTTGSTAPTGTGSANDGAVAWSFVRAFSAGTVACSYNEISSNMVRQFGTARYLDASGGVSNEFTGGLVPVVIPSPLIASQVSNTGGVSSIGLPVGSYSIPNGPLPLIAIAPPSAQGQQAAAVIASMFMFGFGTLSNAGSGYVVGDVLKFVDGTPTSGSAVGIKATTVDANGAITGFTNGGGSYTYTALPPAGNTKLAGGTGTGAELTGTVWHVNAITVTAQGSGYTSVPAVTYSPKLPTATSTAVLSSVLTLNSGVGQVVMDGTGTKLGIAGAGGSPVLNQGAIVDGSGVRTVLTGASYPVPQNTSLVRFAQKTTIAAQTVTMPSVSTDGYTVQFVQYSGSVTALTFSPAINGWTNGNPLASYTGLRARWDVTEGGWFREQ